MNSQSWVNRSTKQRGAWNPKSGLLSGERNRSSAILRSMVEGVAVIDAQERLVFCNRAFSEILNIDSKSSEGRPLIEVVRNSELTGLIRKALKGEEGLQSDIATGIVQQQSFSVTGCSRESARTRSPARQRATGQSPGTAPCCKNHQARWSCFTMSLSCGRLERVRQDFVANVSHEFKTPLTAIQGFAETLSRRRARRSQKQSAIPRNHARSCEPARAD